MRRRGERARRPTRARLLIRARLQGAVLLAAPALALAAAPWAFASGATGASAIVAPNVAVPVAQPVLGAPAGTTLIGASPGEAAGESWGYSSSGGFSIVRYTEAADTWQALAGPIDARGEPLGGFVPAAGPLAGRTTNAGGIAIVGQDSNGVAQVLVRNPGGGFQEAPTLTEEPKPAEEPKAPAEEPKAPAEEPKAPAEEPKAPPEGPHTPPKAPNALLKHGETLAASSGEGVLMAPVDQPAGKTGLFLVPFEGGAGVQQSVLFYDGGKWTREPICEGLGVSPCKAPTSGFKVLAIDASSPENAWLLAKAGSATEGVVLFSRDTSGTAPAWVQRRLGAAGSLGAQFAQAKPSFSEASVRVTALGNGQPLTVTSQGVWVDGQLAVIPSGQSQQTDGFTLFYEPASSGTGGEVTASWCDVPASVASICTYPLGSELPTGPYRSFAWPGGGQFGERVITGFADGISLGLRGNGFTRVLGAGGDSGTNAGAAFSSPEDGWLASRAGGPLTHLTAHPAPDRVQSWPVPFRRPLTAVAEQPGATGGEFGAQAIAVGESGQVAHYVPGQGWTPEALLSSSGIAQTPNLRGVAWPEPDRAYAVGANGAMWMWRADTGLWEPDPARPPNLFLANFTGIAFDPANPTRGYAIGQQGVLLGFGKTWAQEALPPGLEKADFTSIAFAGGEAFVTYQIPHFDTSEGYGNGFSGGLLVNNGSGWNVDSGVGAALGHFEVPVRVAGLADGGVALATASGHVLYRQGPGISWQSSPAGSAGGYPVALAPFREGGALRSVVSVDTSAAGDLGNQYTTDRALEQAPPAGQAAVATAAFPLAGSGYLLRETVNGWQDEEHQDYPVPSREHGLPSGENGFDWPNQPDAALALTLAPDGSQGWAVGGQTGEINVNVGSQQIEAIQTAGVMRYPANGSAPTGFSTSPEQTVSSSATFAIGGNAQCATACADLAQDQLGPDAWLANAVARAGQTPGVRAFLYTGAHLAPALASATDAAGFQREADRYAELLSGSSGPPAVFAAPSASDLDQSDTLAGFGSAFSTFGSPQGSGPLPAGVAPPISPTSPGSGVYYYSFDSTGPGGRVRVIVVDYSHPTLGVAQECWLAGQLAAAKAEAAPSIVIGSRALNADTGTENVAADGTQVIPIVVNGTPPPGCVTNGPAGGASAYFYDSPQQNRSSSLTAGGASIPTFGSGTLGYISPPSPIDTEFLGASGFLLAEVEVATRNPNSNRARVSVRLTPDISDLALDATNGVLLRRSQPALFKGLARRPRAGMFCQEATGACAFQPDPYVPIPSTCAGTGCATGLLPSYTFTSSNPDVGDFVQPDPASAEGTTVLQGPEGKPIPDSHSGLFCAYNAGTTTVTVQAGGLSSSEQVTVQGGSVEQPCGTVALRDPPAPEQQASLPIPPPAPAPAPAPAPNGVVPPPPSPPPTPSPSAAAIHAHPHPVAPFAPPPASAQLFPIVPVLPPPAPNVARPTPPSGTAEVQAQSPVSQPVGVAEHEREEERATEVVHHMVAYERHPEETPLPAWSLGLVLVAVAVGVGIRRPRSEVARASVE